MRDKHYLLVLFKIIRIYVNEKYKYSFNQKQNNSNQDQNINL